MPLSAQQICELSNQIARVPGFAAQAGQLLNMVLSDLCQTYDFDVAKKTTNFLFNGPAGNGSGPYALPADYLRVSMTDVDGISVPDMFYTIQGVPYWLTVVDLGQYDMMVQTAGFMSFPRLFATNMGVSPPQGQVWPPPNGAYPVTLRYFSQMPDIVTPQTSAAVPWFPNQNYLITRLAGELMRLGDDERAPSYLGSNEETTPDGAGVALRKYLKMKDDAAAKGRVVRLDGRRFNPAWGNLKDTKQVGW